MSEPQDTNEAAGGRSDSTEVLAAKVDELTKKLAHLHCINGTLRKDAERYCWLRDKCTDMENPSHTWIMEAPGELWDDAIDEAMVANK